MPEAERSLVVDIRTGKYSLDQVSKMIVDVENMLVAASNISQLPDRPDYKKVEQWMVSTYLNHWAAVK